MVTNNYKEYMKIYNKSKSIVHLECMNKITKIKMQLFYLLMVKDLKRVIDG